SASDLEARTARLAGLGPLLHGRRLCVREHELEDGGDLAHVGGRHAQGRRGRRAHAQPARVPRPVRVERQRVPVEGHVAFADRRLRLTPGEPKALVHVEEQKMVVRATGEYVHTLRDTGLGEGLGALGDATRVVSEAGLARLPQRYRLRGDGVWQWATKHDRA